MNPILHGTNDEQRIVGLQLLDDSKKEQYCKMRVYTRSEQDDVSHYDDLMYPTFWLSDMSFLNGFPTEFYQYMELEGDNFYKYVVVFKSWFTMWNAVRRVKERAYDMGITDTVKEYPLNIYIIKTPEEQYLMQTGKTLFNGMGFDDVHRYYFDGEMYSSRMDAFPNADRDGDYIYILTAADNRGFKATYYVDDGSRSKADGNLIDHDKVRNGIRFFSEEEMLRQFVSDIVAIDPDTIENHNIFAFDLMYLAKRLERYDIPFTIGRDGSKPDVYDSSKRFAERVIDYPHFKFAGRHVIDTMFETMNYDTMARDLPGYGLKVVSQYFGFAPEGRTYIDGDKLSAAWDSDPMSVLNYADDDVVEVSRLSKHLGGSTFYLTQMLPMTYQRASLSGTATKIEYLLVRQYLVERYSLPTNEAGKQEVGGYTDLFLTGVYNNVIYADVASLYPSIMLNYGVAPEGDDLELFPSLLSQLTDLRLSAKTEMNKWKKKVKTIEKKITKLASDATVGEHVNLGEELTIAKETMQSWNARQSSYKVLINSFYGQLGYSGAKFNDFSEADRVTVIGQQLLRQMIRLIVEDGGTVIEVDTDGILTMAPEFVYTLDDEEDKVRAVDLHGDAAIDDESYVKKLTERMPEGINIDFDGRAKRMMSYKKKNYALREPGKDRDKIKGGSMVSRSYEPFGIAYIRKVVKAMMDRDVETIAKVHRETMTMIQTGDWTPDDFAKRSRLKDAIETYIVKVKRGVGKGGRNKDAGYELAIKRWEDTGNKPESGDTIKHYVRGDDKAYKVKVNEKADFINTWIPGEENTYWYVDRLTKFAKKFKKFFSDEDHKLIFSDFPIEDIDFSKIQIQNRKVRRDLIATIFVGPEGIDGDFWVERALAGAKFLKTLDTQDHGYSIGAIVTTTRSGMDDDIERWGIANNIPVVRVDEADVAEFGKATARRTAIDLSEAINKNFGEMDQAIIVIEDKDSNNNVSFEVARLAETHDFKSHISTTV